MSKRKPIFDMEFLSFLFLLFLPDSTFSFHLPSTVFQNGNHHHMNTFQHRFTKIILTIPKNTNRISLSSSDDGDADFSSFRKRRQEIMEAKKNAPIIAPPSSDEIDMTNVDKTMENMIEKMEEQTT